jgi:hypothetical protein
MRLRGSLNITDIEESGTELLKRLLCHDLNAARGMNHVAV